MSRTKTYLEDLVEKYLETNPGATWEQAMFAICEMDKEEEENEDT